MLLCEHCQNAIGKRTVDIATSIEILGKEYVLTKTLFVCDSCKRKIVKLSNKLVQQHMALLLEQEKAIKEVRLTQNE